MGLVKEFPVLQALNYSKFSLNSLSASIYGPPSHVWGDYGIHHNR